MKRLMLIVLIAAVSVPLFSQTGYILSVKGRVWVETGTGKCEAAAGTILESGDTVLTEIGSGAVLVIDNDESITLEASSRYTLNSEGSRKEGFFKKVIKGIWKIVSRKFSDTEYSNAAVGTVGAIRGPEDAAIVDFDLIPAEQKDLSALKASVHPDPEAAWTESEIALFGPILESYMQYSSAERLYLKGLADYPDARLLYDMLIDLYMNNEFYKEAQKTAALRPEKE